MSVSDIRHGSYYLASNSQAAPAVFTGSLSVVQDSLDSDYQAHKATYLAQRRTTGNLRRPNEPLAMS